MLMQYMYMTTQTLRKKKGKQSNMQHNTRPETTFPKKNCTQVGVKLTTSCVLDVMLYPQLAEFKSPIQIKAWLDVIYR